MMTSNDALLVAAIVAAAVVPTILHVKDLVASGQIA